MRGVAVSAIALLFLSLGAYVAQPAESVTRLLDEAEAITPLETAIIARDGQILAERGYRGHATTAVTNIKSASNR
ncbi:hypothetical protein [Brenneria tiliae]|uniref:hypothetical protein n=1 Tax=Brenneria tiliae TaxID=2914984 RepID=UPI002014B937|nr:hypothetical protein [Brenneria tiliae]MCL2896870.1 hypothetical protein [Brenneria tiliae]MCL2901428.1 hypothetical protein [Brenneria tiliae]